MTELHRRLLAELTDDRYDSPTEVRLATALRAIVEMHAPMATYPGGSVIGPVPACFGHELTGYDADYPDWPCSTIQTIARELGVTP